MGNAVSLSCSVCQVSCCWQNTWENQPKEEGTVYLGSWFIHTSWLWCLRPCDEEQVPEQRYLSGAGRTGRREQMRGCGQVHPSRDCPPHCFLHLGPCLLKFPVPPSSGLNSESTSGSIQSGRCSSWFSHLPPHLWEPSLQHEVLGGIKIQSRRIRISILTSDLQEFG